MTAIAAKTVTPPVAAKGALGFVLWARQDYPALYRRLVQTIPAVAAVENAITRKTLGDWSDIFSTIGSDISSVASSVGSGVESAFGTIAKTAVSLAPAAASIAGTLISANQQKQVLNTQLQIAQAQRAPAQMAVLPNGQVVPVQPGGVATGAMYAYGGQNYSASLLPSFGGIPTSTLLIGGGVVGALLLIFALRR